MQGNEHRQAEFRFCQEWGKASPECDGMTEKSLIHVAKIESLMLRIREQNVILDKDLAALYGVTTFNLNKAVTRNIERFPDDFMFRLTRKEFNDLKFHFGGASWGGTRKLPRAFTEHGVAVLSGVLRSPRAIQVNIQIMRTFVKLRQIISTHKELQRQLDTLERKYDKEFRVVFEAIRQLMEPPQSKRRRIGFQK